MKALCYKGPETIQCESVADPVLDDPTDAVVRIRSCGICGSDLHIYHGHGFVEGSGYSVGHEAIGEVVEVGSGVRQLRVGDQVMVSGAVGCGACPACLAGHVNRCEHGAMRCYGLGTGLGGCQAEAVTVPAADFNARRIPDGVSADQALMLTDNLPTAYMACLNADVAPGKTVVVVGLGPIGLMAVECAFILGASRVFALDPMADRRTMAEALGAVPLDPTVAKEAIREATRGRMAACVIEAVGSDAALKSAIDLAGFQSTVSIIGVNRDSNFQFPMNRAFFKGLTLRISACSVQSHWADLVPLLQQGRLHPERFITHRLALAEGAEAYRRYAAREPGVLKVLLSP